jgi:phosphoribosyl 1,2-cyclic phosphodiesterase
MQLTVLASSSKANGYLLHNEGEALVIEAGVSLLKVKQALDFRLDIIQGCIVSHRHKDHARALVAYANAGIDILAPDDVFKEHQPHHRFRTALPGKGYALGNFKIIPFEVQHDVPCYGYLIDHPDSGRILFLTDTYLCEYVFPGLNHILIQANYCDDILEENILAGIEHPGKRERLLTSHMELKTTKAVLMAQDLSTVHNIVLIHLSERNADEGWFVKEVSGVTGKVVSAAKQGVEVDMAKWFG